MIRCAVFNLLKAEIVREKLILPQTCLLECPLRQHRVNQPRAEQQLVCIFVHFYNPVIDLLFFI